MKKNKRLLQGLHILAGVAMTLFLCTCAQAGINHQLNSGPFIVEDLGAVGESASLDGYNYFLDPLTNQWHYFMYFWMQATYASTPFQVFDVNLSLGTARVVDAVPGRRGPEAEIIHPNGKIYIGSGGGPGGYLLEYDINSGLMKTIQKLADDHAQSLSVGDDNAIYIGEGIYGYVERYDPGTETWENYGILDDPGPPYYRYAYTVGGDGRFVYVAMRDEYLAPNPWYAVVYDRQTNTQKTFWKRESIGATYIGITKGADGWYAVVRKDIPHGAYSFTDFPYKLNGQNDPIAESTIPPLPAQPGFPYLVDTTQVAPDSTTGGNVTLRWAPQLYGQPNGPWQEATATVRIGGVTIKRLYPFSDSELLAITDAYGPVLRYNPETLEKTAMGRSIISVYDALYNGSNKKWYISGYPQVGFMEYDPAQAWTITGNQYEPTINPHLLPIAPAGVAKYYYHLARDNEGGIYLGGHHERDGRGGSLGWYLPGTGATGGLRDAFLEYDVRDLISILDAQKIVYSGLAIDGSGKDGTLFVIDPVTKQIEKEYIPVPGSRDPGMIVEVEPGVVCGVIYGNPVSQIYKFDLNTGTLVYRKDLAGRAFGANVVGQDWRLLKGPDEYLWLYLSDAIYRINPADGIPQKILDAPLSGNLLFYKDDLYIYGGYYSQTTRLRRIKGLFTLVMYGDVNSDGQVSAYDAALTARHAVGYTDADFKNASAADVDNIPGVSAYDAALIAQRAVGLISKFPAEP